jgi:prepilin-type N-terminal cleavage/methylation domain-containing protein
MSSTAYQKGFNIIEVIMAVAIVGLVAAVGWLYWQNSSTTNVNKDEVQTTQAPSQDEARPSTKTHTSSDIGVAFDYPSTWTSEKIPSSAIYDQRAGSETMLLKAPSGFSIFFASYATTGLGGAGPCDGVLREVTNEGITRIGKGSVVSLYFNNDFYLVLTENENIKNGPGACGVGSGLQFRETSFSTDPEGNCCTKPYQIGFGTVILGQEPISTTKPSDKEYMEAVEIIKSLRTV